MDELPLPVYVRGLANNRRLPRRERARRLIEKVAPLDLWAVTEAVYIAIVASVIRLGIAPVYVASGDLSMSGYIKDALGLRYDIPYTPDEDWTSSNAGLVVPKRSYEDALAEQETIQDALRNRGPFSTRPTLEPVRQGRPGHLKLVKT